MQCVADLVLFVCFEGPKVDEPIQCCTCDFRAPSVVFSAGFMDVLEVILHFFIAFISIRRHC